MAAGAGAGSWSRLERAGEAQVGTEEHRGFLSGPQVGSRSADAVLATSRVEA